MSFLAPLFLLGAIAVAAPVIFHLIRRTTREVTPFSTLMFLQPTPPRVTRRSRLENLWLLLLRCLVIALLACGFARPFLQSKANHTGMPDGIGKHIVILVDTSASMRRENLWEAARAKVDELLRRATPADEFALIAFDREVRPVVSFEDWKNVPPGERAALASQKLAAFSPSWSATHLDVALLHAAGLLDQPAEEMPHPREILVVSDMQEGSRLEGVQGYEWPRGIQVTLEPVKASEEQNASVQWISESEEGEKSATDEATLRLRVNAAVEANHDEFKLRWADAAANDESAKMNVYLPGGRSHVVRAPKQPNASSTSLILTGDKAEFDNKLFILPPDTSRVPVLFLGQDADDDPRASLYYLRRAFPKTRRQNIEITAYRSDEAVPTFQLQQAQLLVIGDAVSEAALASARQFARDGRIVIAPLTSAASAPTIARLFELPQVPATEAPVKDYALLAQIDFQHPLFAPFADPRFSDFTKIHFWKYRRLDVALLGNAQIIARFDSGDPAIVQAPLGKGNVVIFTSSWRPIDSQLALSSKFVPLLNALLEQSSNLPVQKAQYFVGDEVPLPHGAQPLTVRKPDGTEVAAVTGSNFTATDQPGIYAVSPGTQRFVVNLAPEESRIAPLAADRFTSLGIPMSQVATVSPAKAAREQARAQAAELENRQKIWRWLIIAALGVLLLETLIAGRLSRITPIHAS